VPDNRPLFSAPSTTAAPATHDVRTTNRPDLRTQDLGVNAHGEPRRRANPGDELTVDPTDRRRRARAALLDLRRDVIRRESTTW